MRALAGCSLGVLVLAGACTQDFDQFSATPGPASGAGGNPTTTAQGGNGTTTTASGSGGGTTSSAPSSSSTTGGEGSGQGGNAGPGGSGGMSPTGAGGSTTVVMCGNDPCDIEAGAVCCVPNNGNAPSCNTSGSCGGNAAPVTCDEPSDCPGEICCGSYNAQQEHFDEVQCAARCNGGDAFALCDPSSPNACGNGFICEQSDELPDGFFVCIED